MNIIWHINVRMNLSWKIWVIINHYLKKDVLLLPDAFEKFIDMCLKFYKLDPFDNFSSPGLSWDAMLKMTGVKLDTFQTLTCNYVFKKDWDEGLLTLLRDKVKQITNTWKIMIQQNC